jgi:hypothetical protein
MFQAFSKCEATLFVVPPSTSSTSPTHLFHAKKLIASSSHNLCMLSRVCILARSNDIRLSFLKLNGKKRPIRKMPP